MTCLYRVSWCCRTLMLLITLFHLLVYIFLKLKMTVQTLLAEDENWQLQTNGKYTVRVVFPAFCYNVNQINISSMSWYNARIWYSYMWMAYKIVETSFVILFKILSNDMSSQSVNLHLCMKIASSCMHQLVRGGCSVPPNHLGLPLSFN
jgi:hypothetical protein